MSYTGANQATEAREVLSKALAALQDESGLPSGSESIAESIALAVGELFEAANAKDNVAGASSVHSAVQHLSQTLALLQDVREGHAGVVKATDMIAEAMGVLYPLTAPLSISPPQQAPQRAAENANQGTASPKRPSTDQVPERNVPAVALEANIGATTDSNFFVGFSGEVAEGGVYLATCEGSPLGTPVDLHVTLPGGFEFRTKGKVIFVHDPIDQTSGAMPAVGVGFKNLDAESRSLVLRFVKNRPPLFFD